MNSILRWIGGKKLLREKIVSLFPKHSTYVEVFGGAGWVLFHKERSKFEIYNDITTNLTNLFIQIKHHPEAMQKELQFSLPSRHLFNFTKGSGGGEPLTEIQRAARFLWLIKYSFAAKGETFAASKLHAPASLEKIYNMVPDIAKRLDRVTIENLSFEKCIEKYDGKETFFYLDPPYFQCQNYNFVGAKFSAYHHQQLAEILKQTKGKWLLSYNDHPKARELYAARGIKIETIDRDNNMGKNRSERYRELLIRNY